MLSIPDNNNNSVCKAYAVSEHINNSRHVKTQTSDRRDIDFIVASAKLNKNISSPSSI